VIERLQAFRVRSTARFDRLEKSHRKRHKEFIEIFADALTILEQDPLGRTRIHQVKKLANVKAGEGQYRLRLGRWRFRYDVEDADVTLRYCGLRREDTYR
jgi:mRNA-degrading endonuclease RelE of RelBE toxin-antitoxin system